MHGKICMVIGNGEMGKVAAQTLRDAGANVTVTVRQYRSGMVSIPIGCSRIHYGERMNFLPNCDIVVSATASPNFAGRIVPGHYDPEATFAFGSCGSERH